VRVSDSGICVSVLFIRVLVDVSIDRLIVLID